MKHHVKMLMGLCIATVFLTAGMVSCNEKVSDPSPSPDTKHTHVYTATVVDPTCTEKGYTAHVCAACMDSYVDSEIPALGHDYKDAVIEPTCTEGGHTDHTCTRCGDAYTDGEVAPLGHSYDDTEVAPTCTEEGYTIHTCTVCSESVTDTKTAALGHSYVDKVKTPTCTEGGLTTHTCSTCGDQYKDGVTEALGHSYTDEVVAPSCTAEGYTRRTCGTCADTYDCDVTAMIPHPWEEWIVTRKATCTREGSQMHICSTCQAAETVTLDILPHAYGITVVEPTCTEQGYIQHICAQCEDSYKDNYSDALGHDWGKYTRDEAEQATYAPCRECDAKRYIQYIDAYYNGIRLLTGETVAADDVVVTAVLDDGSTFDVKEFTLTPALIEVAGDNTVTVEYLGLTADISVKAIWNNDPTANPASDFYYTVDGDSIIITEYTGSRKNVVIPAHIGRVPVTIIECGAFTGIAIESVFIPNSIVEIAGKRNSWENNGVFSDCGELKTVTIGNSLHSIETEVFKNCSSLTAIIIPDSVTYIADYAFVGCSSLDTVVLHEGLQSIGRGAFMGTPITSLVIPDSVINISGDTNSWSNDGAFSNCQELQSVIIGNGLKSIEADVFKNCYSLETVTIGLSVDSIAQNAFENCSSLTAIDIPGNVISIDGFAFVGCSSLQTVVLHEGLQSIGRGAFMGTPITSLVIPDSVINISGDTNSWSNDGAFSNCQKLQSVIIGTGLKTLEQDVFYGCTSLTQINYTGIEEQWNAIYVETGNDPIKKASVSFNYKP